MADVVRGSIVAVLIGALGLVTWGVLDGDGPGPWGDEIGEARARWEAAGVDDYTVHVDFDCYCAWQEVTATIVDGEIVTAFDQDGEPIEPYRLLDVAPVESWLDDAERANDAGNLAEFASDPELGHPTLLRYETDDEVDHSGGVSTITVTV
jgi:hypothetical protein